MADRHISALPQATEVALNDLFVMEQASTAKKITGQTLIAEFAGALDGHGGIASITWTTSGTAGDGQLHTGTITYADGTTSTITIKDGVKGDQGIQGIQGIRGLTGNGIFSITLTSGTHAAGTTDHYRVTYTDGNTFDFEVYNGANGTGTVSSVAGVPAQGNDVPLIVFATSAPTESTAGYVKQLLFDTTSNIMYICTAISGNTYTWIPAGVVLDFAVNVPLMDGTASVGVSDRIAREDHVHPTDLSRQSANLYFENVTLATSAWVADNTYSDFPYRAAITCQGVTTGMCPEVIFSPADAMSGSFAPVAHPDTNTVYIYATAIPSDTITIPTIVVSDASAIHETQQSYNFSKEAEAWAVGQKGGVDVPTTDDTYHNNSKYYAEQAAQSATEAAAFVGSPLQASTVAEMTDTTKIYVYTGSQTGYSNGHWYYYDGFMWQDGGAYNATVDIATETEILEALYGVTT